MNITRKLAVLGSASALIIAGFVVWRLEVTTRPTAPPGPLPPGTRVVHAGEFVQLGAEPTEELAALESRLDGSITSIQGRVAALANSASFADAVESTLRGQTAPTFAETLEALKAGGITPPAFWTEEGSVQYREAEHKAFRDFMLRARIDTANVLVRPAEMLQPGRKPSMPVAPGGHGVHVRARGAGESFVRSAPAPADLETVEVLVPFSYTAADEAGGQGEERQAFLGFVMARDPAADRWVFAEYRTYRDQDPGFPFPMF